ncbi:MAG TPA: nitronate monooxygenase [Kofleriaceae bacterium]|nr:nitronate monooxygenase [Kofleriaceae bacterium]
MHSSMTHPNVNLGGSQAMAADESRKLSRRAALKLMGKVAGAAAGAAVLSRASKASAHRRSNELDTRMTRELGLRVPLASAGMAFVALPDLASAVSNAGALGVYGVGIEPPFVVEARLQQLAAQTRKPFGVDLIVGTSPMGPITTQDHIDVVAAAGVPVVVFHFDVPTRDWVDQLHAAGSKVWVQTGDVRVAQRAVALGVDGIVAQGRSAGGHNKNATVPTWRLVFEMRLVLPARIIILASGGIANGESLVRAIRAGADGGWAGTVFVAAQESYAHEGYKARLCALHAPGDTQFTTVFGPEWPGQPQRVLCNVGTRSPSALLPAQIGTTLLFPGIGNVPYDMPKHSAIVPTRDTQGDLDEMDMPAGALSIAAVRRVRPAADIVNDFIQDAHDACDRDARFSLDDD